MQISVLDLSPIPSGATASQALRNTIDLAKHVEALGFHRYWLAEHHNAGALASSTPEIMIAAVAAETSRIRVGSGGIMLPNHSPLKIAETFRVLSALYPDRIDLGVGRAAGTDPKTALALRQSRELLAVEGFPAQLDELMTYLARETDPAARFGPIKAVPFGVPPPPLFYLGSGREGADLAARLGLGFAYAHHIVPDGVSEAMRSYRAAFRPSSGPRAARSILAVAAICAATEADAEDLARCADLAMVRFGQGLRDMPMPSVEEARAYAFDAEEDVFRRASRARSVVGTPARVKETLRRLLDEAEADELMVVTYVHDHEERKRSYDRLADAFATP
ncbi:MAG: LLM class flavin-dependent oxidoreductase [Labilithrix sp.]|nr:LLM class flavin-dependent oxidoreductase [Labilithrix sp.]